MTIGQKIRDYHRGMTAVIHHRYRSWEHCYGFFRRIGPQGIAAQPDNAAIQLGFYLASWGMYRNSFLLQHAYTVHLGAVECLAMPLFAPLWQTEFGSSDADVKHIPLIGEAIEAIRRAYKPFGRKQATDTLVTKVLLGTLGCLPACDLYFRHGLKKEGLKYSRLNKPFRFVDRILRFCRENKDEFRTEQNLIKTVSGVHYPLMKLVDMYFWQFGRPSGGGPPAQ